MQKFEVDLSGVIVIVGIITTGCVFGCTPKDANHGTGQAFVQDDNVAVTRVEFEGHRYLMFNRDGYGAAVLHDPDCPKDKK